MSKNLLELVQFFRTGTDPAEVRADLLPVPNHTADPQNLKPSERETPRLRLGSVSDRHPKARVLEAPDFRILPPDLHPWAHARERRQIGDIGYHDHPGVLRSQEEAADRREEERHGPGGRAGPRLLTAVSGRRAGHDELREVDACFEFTRLAEELARELGDVLEVRSGLLEMDFDGAVLELDPLAGRWLRLRLRSMVLEKRPEDAVVLQQAVLIGIPGGAPVDGRKIEHPQAFFGGGLPSLPSELDKLRERAPGRYVVGPAEHDGIVIERCVERRQVDPLRSIDRGGHRSEAAALQGVEAGRCDRPSQFRHRAPLTGS